MIFTGFSDIRILKSSFNWFAVVVKQIDQQVDIRNLLQQIYLKNNINSVKKTINHDIKTLLFDGFSC